MEAYSQTPAGVHERGENERQSVNDCEMKKHAYRCYGHSACRL